MISGALRNPLTLVFTPFQHQQGVLMVSMVDISEQVCITQFTFCSFLESHSLKLPHLFISFFSDLPFVGIIVTEVPRNEVFHYLLDQPLHTVPTLSTIKEPLILTSSQVVTLTPVLDSPDGSNFCPATGRFVALCFFPKFYLCLSIVTFTKVSLVSQGLIQ